MSTQREFGYDDQSNPSDQDYPSHLDTLDCDIVRPINWNTLEANEAEHEWLDLNRFVDWLRRTFGLPPTMIPPLWHRHDELVWELSALHLHFRNCYDREASGSAPIGFMREFAESRQRLREWVATCGTRLDHDRPTRITAWPGEQPRQPEPEVLIGNRDEDFVAFVLDDMRHRPGGASLDADLPGTWAR